MMKNKHNCNDCDAQCAGDVIRDKRGNFVRFTPCKGQKKPQSLRTPILVEALLSGRSAGVSELLKRFNIRLSERLGYPYFVLSA